MFQRLRPLPGSDASGQPIVQQPLEPPRPPCTLQMPEIFQERHNIEGWLKRMRQYFAGNGFTHQMWMSDIFRGRLSGEVHGALNDILLLDQVWNEPVQLGAVLLEVCGDGQTMNDYQSDSNATLHHLNESVT